MVSETKKKTELLSAFICIGFVMGLFSFVVSCKQKAAVSNVEVCIPVPDDTSALGKMKHFIPKDRMESFEKDFGGQRDSLMLKSGLFIPQSEAFNKPAILEILKDPKCVGIKIYYGIKKGDKANEMRMMIVGVDSQGNDLYITDTGAAAQVATQVGGGGLGGNEYGQCTPPCPDGGK